MPKSNGFREDEIVILSHYDKREKNWVQTSYPKIGGRLRLAHEDNEQLSINTEVVQFDTDLAVVRAVVGTSKGDFSGLGMSSVDRDQTIAPAILELAESRAIARALRFAGYGVEYCGAEEVSHLDVNGGFNNDGSSSANHQQTSSGNGGNGGYRQSGKGKGGNNGGNKRNSSNGNGNGNSNGRITNRQLNFAVNLGKDQGLSSKDLDDRTLDLYGVKLNHLSRKDASDFIASLQQPNEDIPF
jgi:hypothetical protein